MLRSCAYIGLSQPHHARRKLHHKWQQGVHVSIGLAIPLQHR